MCVFKCCTILILTNTIVWVGVGIRFVSCHNVGVHLCIYDTYVRLGILMMFLCCLLLLLETHQAIITKQNIEEDILKTKI